MFYNLCMNRLTTLPKNHQHQILTVQFWSIDTFITCNTYVPTSTMQFIWHFINQSKTNYAYLLNTLSKSSLNTTKCTTLWYVQNEIELYIQPYFLLCLSLFTFWLYAAIWRFFWQFTISKFKLKDLSRKISRKWSENHSILRRAANPQFRQIRPCWVETKKFFGLCYYVNWVSGWSPTPQGVQLSPDFCSDFRSSKGKPSRLWSLVVGVAEALA